MDRKKHYSREESRAIDKEIISQGTPGIELMSRAGAAATSIISEHWPDANSITIFCGLGNNAGDGYIVARLLKGQNKIVQVIQIGDPNKLQGDALTAYTDAINAGVISLPWSITEDFPTDVFVDALLGTGLNIDLTGDFLSAVQYLNQQNKPILAIDIPTGLDANNGMPLGDAVKADVTVTFIVYKQGLFSGDAEKYCGKVVLAELV